MRLTQLKDSPIALFDWVIASLASILTGIGLVLIYSATNTMGESGGIFLTRQIMWCFLAIIICSTFLLFDYAFLDKWALGIYTFIILSLIMVWAVGRVTAGSRRWIEIGFMRFQPSEFAKPAIVIILAKYFSKQKAADEFTIIDLIKPTLLVFLPAFLVLLQPDLGTALVIVFIAGSMILFAGINKRISLVGAGLLCVITPILYFLSDKILLAYQRKRIITFLSPDTDPLGAGYHILQSQIAIGAGGAFGTGFLKGTQNQLMFLPVKHTDFIFSILAEEWGFIGCSMLLLLFFLLCVRGLWIANKARNDFGALLAFGCVMILFWHVVINTAMVMGLLPVVGVPLSFISYGGSSLIASYFCIGVLLNVAMRRFSY